MHDHHHDCPDGIDAGAYVLYALDDVESSAFAAHVASCGTCRQEVAELQPVADTLPLATTQYGPPPALKSRIMAVVNAEAELLAAAGAGADRVVRDAPRARRSWIPSFSLRAPLAGALACGMLALGVVGGVIASGGSGGDAAPSSTIVASAPAGATAKVVRTGDTASLQVSNLPSPPAGYVYQVWFDRGKGAAEPTHALFNVRSTDGRATVALDESVAGVKQVLVTAEPSGGSFEPSSAPVITATL